MRIVIVAVGRMKSGPERELVSRYLDRAIAAGRSLGLTGFNIVELAESRAANAAARKAEEANAIRKALPQNGLFCVLDERGASMTSEKLTARIADWRDGGNADLGFVIGGADGLDHGLLDEAVLSISFSPLTWPHQLVRIMLAEQLYRATTILTGHPYHRGI